MKRPVALVALVALSSLLIADPFASSPLTAAITPPVASVPAASTAQAVAAVPTAIAAVAVAVAAASLAPARAPALDAPTVVVQSVAAPAANPAANPTDTRTAYVNALYMSVVPGAERAALAAGHYLLGYDLVGLSCGTGCTGVIDGQVRSSFNATFFAESAAYQRNTIAHEAAHAFGFLYIGGYATPSWAAIGGWQSQFDSIDRSFASTYDAEAWAACVAWQESGFNDVVDQITHACTAPAAALAMAQLS
jgi:hypothetical protein